MHRKPGDIVPPRRAHRRIGCNLSARWTYGGLQEIGCVRNLSLNGFCIRTRTIHPPGFAATFNLSGPGVEVSVEARVTWTREIQAESASGMWHEMGLVLKSQESEEFRQLLMVSDVAGMLAVSPASPAAS